MRNAFRIGLIGLFALGLVASVVITWQKARSSRSTETLGGGNKIAGNGSPEGALAASVVPLYGDGFVEDSGYEVSLQFTDKVADRSSLDQLRDEARGRSRRGIAELRQKMSDLSPQDGERNRLELMVGLLHMWAGEFDKATDSFDRILANAKVEPAFLANIVALRGVASLRRGEVANCIACIGPSSCLFPIAPEAIHQQPEGSRAAVRDFTEYLQKRPDDLGVRWLLNIAHMTLGEYPDKVPPAHLISLDHFRSKHDPGRFTNVSLLVGLNKRGENMVGGSIFDDFTGDGLPDIVVVSDDCDLGTSLFVNRGDGKFEDRGVAAGLANQTLSLNAKHADFDNDGKLDILLLRGGWEFPGRLSLLRNTGGKFEDVTVASGLAEPIASESAAWGDYDNDGLIDLYVAGESRPNGFESANRCRLYHNEGNGKFVDVAASAGVLNERWTKGTAWGDYDSDGFLDLYISNLGSDNRLYHNNGDGTFTDVAEKLHVTEPKDSFACWFWDYDNDGRLDIFVACFRATLNEYVKDVLGLPSTGERPRLYRNLGAEGFRDVTHEVGLDRVLMIMGSNFADIDNDGFLDVYLGTGLTTYSSLVPNVMFKNLGGQRFEDVTVASGTGHLQKGHGISFADWDGDGDLDLFVETGGSVPGDKAHNSLFQNPGHNRHWIALKLVGTKTNRAAIGAEVRVDYRDSDGKKHSVYRTVSSGSSFGGNSLVVHVGLNAAAKADTVNVRWPGGKSASVFRDVEADQTLEITEGTESFRKLPTRRIVVPASVENSK